MTLATKIKSLRKEKGYTLEKLAELTESVKSYIWELENKHIPSPSADKILKIARALGVTVEYLMDDKMKDFNANDVENVFFAKYRKAPANIKWEISQILDVLTERTL